MAVGKGSMERASKAVKKQENNTPAKEVAEIVVANSKSPVKKETEKKTTTKKAAPKKAVSKKTETKKSVVTNTSVQVMEQIVYQTSSQMLNRDAKENETFGVGDAMPVYYF